MPEHKQLEKKKLLVPILVALIVVVTGALAFVFKPWESVSSVSVDLPIDTFEGIEPILAAQIKEYSAAVEEDKSSAEAWGYLGGVYDVHDFTEKAIDSYKRAQELDTEDFRWPYFLGIKTLLSDQQAALNYFLQAVDLKDDYAPLHVQAGRGYLQLEQVDAAESHFLKAKELDPNLLRVHIGLAEIALAKSNAEEALEHLNVAVELGPDVAEVYRLLSETQRRLGNMEEAQRNIDLAGDKGLLAPLPDKIRTEFTRPLGVTTHLRKQRTDYLLEQGKVSEAIEDWKQVLVYDPTSDDAHSQLGILYITSNKPDVALNHFQQAVKSNPNNAAAYASIGNLYVKQRNSQKAIQAFENAIKADPDLNKARSTLGSILVSTGKIERGLLELRTSCSGKDFDPSLLVNLALGLTSTGNFEEASGTYKRLLNIQPDNTRIKFELGIVLDQLEKFDEASGYFREVITDNPTLRTGYSNLARTLRKSRRYSESISVLIEARRKIPNDKELALETAWMLATCPDDYIRDGYQSLEIIEPLGSNSQNRDPRITDTLSAAYAEVGDFSNAVRYIKLAINQIGKIPPNVNPPFDRESYLVTLQGRLELFNSGMPFRDMESE